MICSILASTNSGGIGNRGTLPWPKHNGDLRWFQEHTLNNVVIMGRKTWDDPQMPNPLPNRINYVVSTRSIGAVIAQRLHGDISGEVKNVQKEHPRKDVFIIGGKSIYESTEPIVDRVYLTRMKGNWFADTRLDLEKYLTCFRLYSVRPGEDCTYEVWNRVLF